MLCKTLSHPSWCSVCPAIGRLLQWQRCNAGASTRQWILCQCSPPPGTSASPCCEAPCALSCLSRHAPSPPTAAHAGWRTRCLFWHPPPGGPTADTRLVLEVAFFQRCGKALTGGCPHASAPAAPPAAAARPPSWRPAAPGRAAERRARRERPRPAARLTLPHHSTPRRLQAQQKTSLSDFCVLTLLAPAGLIGLHICHGRILGRMLSA